MSLCKNRLSVPSEFFLLQITVRRLLTEDYSTIGVYLTTKLHCPSTIFPLSVIPRTTATYSP